MTAFAGAVNPLTTIALPTYDAWREAATSDDNTNLIVSALVSGDVVKKKTYRRRDNSQSGIEVTSKTTTSFSSFKRRVGEQRCDSFAYEWYPRSYE